MTIKAFTGNLNDTYVLQEAISAYSDEAYTTAKKLSGTGIVGSNPLIDVNTETFIGQVRWLKPLNPTINVASLTDSSDGAKTTFASDYLRYVKSVRTHGAEKINMQQIVTQQDGLAKVGRDFGQTRSQDEHNAILAVLKGVAMSEVLNGASAGSGSTGLGGQSFDNDPEDKKYGFYVDLGAAKPIVDATVSIQGAARAEGFLQAIGKAFKDYEPEYAYLVTSPEVYASLRSANLVDEIGVVDGNITFSTIFNGKFRIIQTRASQGFTTAELTKINTGAGVDIVGTKTSFIVLPGALALQSLMVPDQTEIYRNANTYKGGGGTSIWYRWGYVLAPAGYDWNGSQDKFASDDEYKSVIESGTAKLITAATSTAACSGTWVRKAASALSLGILPVFHS
jgi:hypothetical protein